MTSHEFHTPPSRRHAATTPDATSRLAASLEHLRDHRDHVAAQSPLSRTLIDKTAAGTYDRLAPLIAELDPAWAAQHGHGSSPFQHATQPDTTDSSPTPSNTVRPDSKNAADAAAAPPRRRRITTALATTIAIVRHPRSRERS